MDASPLLKQRPRWQRRARIPLLLWQHYRFLRHPKGLAEVQPVSWWVALRVAWSMAWLLWPQRHAPGRKTS